MSTAPLIVPWKDRKRLQLLAQSAPLRTALRRALSNSDFSLAPDAIGPSDATRAIDQAGADCLILDVELPGLHGLELVRKIRAVDPALPIIVLAPEGWKGHAIRAEAMECGAVGVILKPSGDEPLASRAVAQSILGVLAQHRWAARTAPLARTGRTTPSQPASGDGSERSSPSTGARAMRPRAPAKVLVVASSTGGPQALIAMFSAIPPSAIPAPVLVVQHMPAAFTPILADHMSRATGWCALEARADEPLAAGQIRIAPGGYHMVVGGTGGAPSLKLTETPQVNFCRPSADVLFVSAAQRFGSAVLAVILTGMGNDGCEGAKAIAAAGGTVFAQDRETSVVWGMPGSAVGAGVVDRVLALDGIAAAVKAAMGGGA
ncbi:chemotaxis protein CheB [Acuticoccus sp.]|uniref:chemotaxis protein CheB n=1 Tax=Acuticoccus sp. TaxID=1904378 RepID=UPI003B52E3FD